MIIPVDSPEQLVAGDKPKVVCFTNPVSCVPCAALKPHFERVAAAALGVADFMEVNVLDHMHIAAEYGVSGTPTILFIDRNGVTDVKARAAMPLVSEINSLIEA